MAVQQMKTDTALMAVTAKNAAASAATIKGRTAQIAADVDELLSRWQGGAADAYGQSLIRQRDQSARLASGLDSNIETTSLGQTHITGQEAAATGTLLSTLNEM